jgi:hypothetical protein
MLQFARQCFKPAIITQGLSVCCQVTCSLIHTESFQEPRPWGWLVRLQKDSSTSAVPQFSLSLAHCHTPLLGADLATLCRRGAAVSCRNPPYAAAFMLQGLFTNDYLLEFSSALFEVEPLRLVPMTCSQWTGPAHLPDPSRRDGSQTCFTLNPARPARLIRSTPHAAGSHRAPVAHSRVVDLDLDGGQTPMDGLISTPDPECGHMPNARQLIAGLPLW